MTAETPKTGGWMGMMSGHKATQAEGTKRRGIAHTLWLGLGTAGLLLLFDLTWLGWLGKDFYDQQLGPLRRPQVHAGAAGLFYVMYLLFTLGVCILPSATARAAALRGAGLGFLAYATYELTNWAVIAGWPAALVPVDIAWGVVLTSGVSLLSKLLDLRLSARARL
jgi:uncharacterized membrane protein